MQCLRQSCWRLPTQHGIGYIDCTCEASIGEGLVQAAEGQAGTTLGWAVARREQGRDAPCLQRGRHVEPAVAFSQLDVDEREIRPLCFGDLERLLQRISRADHLMPG